VINTTTTTATATAIATPGLPGWTGIRKVKPGK